MAEREYWDQDDDRQLQHRAMADEFGLPPQSKPPAVSAPQTDPVSNTLPVSAPEPPAPSTPPAVTPQTFQGFTPTHAMEGFNTGREQNTGKSAKDAFAYLSNQAPPPPLNDKAALGAWFQQHIAPGMNALGHNVSSVEGDKFKFKNWQGEFDVDYGRGAGADGGALAWQVDDNTAVMPENPVYQPRQLQLAPLEQGPTEGGDDPMARILAEIEALKNGSTTPTQYDAMARQFEV